MPIQRDAVVVGAGHNGLTCACYLARAGLKVLVLEQYRAYGGMTVSEELAAPGFLSDLHANGYLVAKLSPAPQELQLADRGLELITPEPNWGHVLADGRCLTISRDLESTLAIIAQFSKRDAETWRRLYGRYLEAKPHIVAGMNAPPPPLAKEFGRPEAVSGYRFEFQARAHGSTSASSRRRSKPSSRPAPCTPPWRRTTRSGRSSAGCSRAPCRTWA
jgi:beta-carotene ketolase (CrtO type)